MNPNQLRPVQPPIPALHIKTSTRGTIEVSLTAASSIDRKEQRSIERGVIVTRDATSERASVLNCPVESLFEDVAAVPPRIKGESFFRPWDKSVMYSSNSTFVSWP